MKANERIMNAFLGLEDSLDGTQRRGFASDGFAYIKKLQLEKLLKDQGLVFFLFFIIFYCFR
jgi:hypothetical protein